jgi:hypothetical protein
MTGVLAWVSWVRHVTEERHSNLCFSLFCFDHRIIYAWIVAVRNRKWGKQLCITHDLREETFLFYSIFSLTESFCNSFPELFSPSLLRRTIQEQPFIYVVSPSVLKSCCSAQHQSSGLFEVVNGMWWVVGSLNEDARWVSAPKAWLLLALWRQSDYIANILMITNYTLLL